MNNRFKLSAPFFVALCLVFFLLASMAPSAIIALSPSLASNAITEPESIETAVSPVTTSHISNITGAVYNEERGEIIVFGVADPGLPPMDYDYIQENLIIALRAYYDADRPDVPGVSIEGTEDPLEVVYFGNITNTHFGNVSFESDRLLKTYTMGKDNLTGQVITSSVPGYQSYPDRMSQIVDTTLDSVLTRYFFTPTLRIEENNSPHGIVFSNTQKFVDWGYLGGTPSQASTQAAQGFVDNFNENYWEYAAERYDLHGDTTLYEMIQLAKLTAIAKWAQDKNLELQLPGINDPWLNNHPITSETTPLETPGISVSWTQQTNQGSYIAELRGGVYALGYIEWIPSSSEGQGIINLVWINRQPAPPPPMMSEIQYDYCGPLGDPAMILQENSCAIGNIVSYMMSISDDAVSNGDFENGPGSWVENSAFPIVRTESPLHGNYGAILPVYHNADVSMQQVFHIPADADKAMLTYWRAIGTDETTHPHDYFSVYLTDLNDNVLTTFEVLNDGDADGYWHQVSFDASTYAGQTVKLWFAATTDAANITNFFVDDVSLDYLDEVAPSIHSISAPDQVISTGGVSIEVVFDEQMTTAVSPAVTFKPTQALQSLLTTEIYTFTARTDAGYTNGFLETDPTRWVGDFNFTNSIPEGEYEISVSSGQDIALNVMFPAENIHSFINDMTAPEINYVYPISASTEVPVSESLVVTFTEPIDTDTFNFTVLPNPGGWSASWNALHTVITLNHDDFAPNTTYNVSVNQADDLIGHILVSAPVSWSFATVTVDTTSPTITQTYPVNNANNVPANATLLVTFDEEINTSSFVYEIMPDPGGTSVIWNGANTVASIGHNAFSPGQSYQVMINQAQDLAGNALASAPYQWGFSVVESDTTAPEITDRYPQPDATEVGWETAVVISFTEPINIATFAFISIPDPGGWLPSWNNNYTLLTLNHPAFTPGTEYQITILTAEDLAGNDLTLDKTWIFETIHEFVYLPMIIK